MATNKKLIHRPSFYHDLVVAQHREHFKIMSNKKKSEIEERLGGLYNFMIPAYDAFNIDLKTYLIRGKLNKKETMTDEMKEQIICEYLFEGVK